MAVLMTLLVLGSSGTSTLQAISAVFKVWMLDQLYGSLWNVRFTSFTLFTFTSRKSMVNLRYLLEKAQARDQSC